MIVPLVAPQYCCLVTSGPYFNVILFQFYFLGSKFLLRSLPLDVTVHHHLIISLSCINDIHIPDLTNCIQTTEPMWVKGKHFHESVYAPGPLYISHQKVSTTDTETPVVFH